MGRIRIVNNGTTANPVIAVDQTPHHEYYGDHIAWVNDFGATTVYVLFDNGDTPLNYNGTQLGSFNIPGPKGTLSKRYTLLGSLADHPYQVSNQPFPLVRGQVKAAAAGAKAKPFTSSAADVILD
jgi:hypothetical protein